MKISLFKHAFILLIIVIAISNIDSSSLYLLVFVFGLGKKQNRQHSLIYSTAATMVITAFLFKSSCLRRLKGDASRTEAGLRGANVFTE